MMFRLRHPGHSQWLISFATKWCLSSVHYPTQIITLMVLSILCPAAALQPVMRTWITSCCVGPLLPGHQLLFFSLAVRLPLMEYWFQNWSFYHFCYLFIFTTNLLVFIAFISIIKFLLTVLRFVVKNGTFNLRPIFFNVLQFTKTLRWLKVRCNLLTYCEMHSCHQLFLVIFSDD